MKDQCAICYGLIQMIDVDGVLVLVVLVIHLGRIFLNNLIMQII